MGVDAAARRMSDDIHDKDGWAYMSICSSMILQSGTVNWYTPTFMSSAAAKHGGQCPKKVTHECNWLVVWW